MTGSEFRFTEAEVENLQITGSVHHIVILLTTDNRQKKTAKQVGEQCSLDW